MDAVYGAIGLAFFLVSIAAVWRLFPRTQV